MSPSKSWMRDVADLEVDAAARRRGGPAIRSFTTSLLAVDRDRLAAGERRKVDAVAAAGEAQLDAVVDEALALHARAETASVQHVDGALFEHAGAHAILDILAAPVLDDHRLDALPAPAGATASSPAGPGADDPDLGAFRDHSLSPPA